MRFVRIVALVLMLGAVFAPAAGALGIVEDQSAVPPGEVGRFFEMDFHGHAGCTPYRFAVDSGPLPRGLTLDADTGVLTGYPVDAGTFGVWMAIHDDCGRSSEDEYVFTIEQRSTAILTGALPSASAGASYSATLTASGLTGKIPVWTVTAGSLPAGLKLGTDGTISGTPTSLGTSTFTVTLTATSPAGVWKDAKQFTLSVSGSLAVASTTHVGEVGVPLHATISASGGTAPYSFSAAGALPAGLALAADGTLSGVPSGGGSYALSIHVVDAHGTAQNVDVPLTVRARLAIASSHLRAATVGRMYRLRLAARGGGAGVSWSIARGRLPRGLHLSARGMLTGKPSAAGTVKFTVSARDGLGGHASKKLALSVKA